VGNNDDPQSLHKYLYTYCDPINGIDPSGNDLVEQLCVLAINAIGFAIRIYPVVKILFGVWDAVTVVRILYKAFTGQEVTAGDWVQFGLATVGLLTVPGASRFLGKIVFGNFLRLTIGPSLRTFEGAKLAVGALVRLEESEKPIVSAGKLAYGTFRVENGWPLIRYWRSGNELEDCGTLVHELVHYWHWVK
jgi:hypothetical protein